MNNQKLKKGEADNFLAYARKLKMLIRTIEKFFSL